MLDGVIKFDLEFKERHLDLPTASISSLLSWREILFRLQLVGMDEARYQGYGYGNVSQRLDDGSFLVSGTQTGGIQQTDLEHYARVIDWNLSTNYVLAEGEVKPSSESLTHAAIYELDAQIRFVFHVHSALLWNNAINLDIALTDSGISYGTVEMAAEVKRLYQQGCLKNEILAMGGHEDGIISFGYTGEQAGEKLIDYLAKARVAALLAAHKDQ